LLIAAALILISVGIAHSYLGEKYILVRLFRQPLPKLFGNDVFTKKTLRFAWHITTVAWFGIAAVLLLTASGNLSRYSILNAIGATFAITALTALIASRGKHLSWLAFGAVTLLCFVAARSA
jgi:hypothetical protein